MTDDECTCTLYDFGVGTFGDAADCPVHGEDGDTYRDSLIDDELNPTNARSI